MGRRKQDDPTHLTQAEARRLMAMEKHCRESRRYDFPSGGKEVEIPLVSEDRRHEFILDIDSKRLDLKKFTFGKRYKRVITLVRVDLLTSRRHVNPDRTVITGPHIHEYRAGYGDKWAKPLPDEFGNPDHVFEVFLYFMDFCKIVTKPTFIRSLFTG